VSATVLVLCLCSAATFAFFVAAKNVDGDEEFGVRRRKERF
jgi:hypothetical protein